MKFGSPGVGVAVDWNRGEDTGGLSEVAVHLQRAAEIGIETGYRRANAQRGAHQSICTCTYAARSYAGAACSGADIPAEPAHAASGRVLHDPGIHAQNVIARLGAQNVCVCDVQVVTRQHEIEIVFQRQRNRVIHRQHDFAVMHQLLNTVGVVQIRWRHISAVYKAQ